MNKVEELRAARNAAFADYYAAWEAARAAAEDANAAAIDAAWDAYYAKLKKQENSNDH
jgi:hypothetical protein